MQNYKKRNDAQYKALEFESDMVQQLTRENVFLKNSNEELRAALAESQMLID